MSRVPADADPSALTVAARHVLLDALSALDAHRQAVIVVGAQAVYLRSQDADFTVASYTVDGDLVLDPAHLGPDPQLDAAMQTAGFTLETGPDGRPLHGIWRRTVLVDGEPRDIPVDLLVPASLDASTSRAARGARIPPHPTTAARRMPGMEAVVADHDELPIASLDPTDNRTITANVAGVAALLITKAHKIDDRLDQHRRGKQGRLADKDAGDVVRLMRTSTAAATRATLQRLLADETAGPTTRDGAAKLRAQFGARAAPGVEMAVRTLTGTLTETTVRDLCVAYTRALLTDLPL